MDNDKYIGRLLDNRYEILDVLGVGGMAVVYKARCHRLNRLVAIKILKDDLSSDNEFRRRFHAESQAVAMLSHPNIMSVYDVSTTDEADYIVMELIDGITLKQYMEKKGVLNWKETLHFSMQIAKALEHAHSRGIVHRDIKPHNIMVLKNGSVKVTDFGIARIMSKSNTLTKEALGSVHYISPEQAKGGRVDNRSDLYSLGVVMYEMMTGRAPYDGESPVAVAIQHINGGAPMPSTLNPNIPGGLEQIIMKLMAVEPSKRYTSATELLYDMEEFRKDPAILFDFNNTPIDDAAMRIQSIPVTSERSIQQPRNTAERVAGTRPSQGQPGQRPRTAQSGGQRSPQGSGQRPAQGSGSRPGQSSGQRSAQGSAQRQGQQSQRELTPEEMQRRAARQQQREEEEQRTRMITMAVIGCSVVAVIAIIIFLVMVFNGGLFGDTVELIEVPNLVGQAYDELDRSQYPEFEIVLGDYDYSDDVQAGEIMDQTPKAETTAPEGSEIKVTVSRGPDTQEEVGVMDDLSGTTEQAATDYLDSLKGDLIILPKTENSDTIPEGKVIRTEPEKGQTLTRGQTVILWISAGEEVVEEFVPTAVNKKYEDAEKALNDKGFKNVTKIEQESEEDIGVVIEQSVNPGTKMDVTQEIILYVSKGKKIPNLMGKSYSDAEKALNDLGFYNISKETKESTEAENTVINQSLTAGSYYSTSEKIVLTVSEGLKSASMPSVIGQTYEQAKKTLNDAGFPNVTSKEVESNAPKGQVVDQSIKAGLNTALTESIVLSVSTGPKVTKKVTISLPADKADAYHLIIMLADQTIVNQTIQPGTPAITVEMSGRGIMEYQVFIDNEAYKTDKVDFNS